MHKAQDMVSRPPKLCIKDLTVLQGRDHTSARERCNILSSWSVRAVFSICRCHELSWILHGPVTCDTVPDMLKDYVQLQLAVLSIDLSRWLQFPSKLQGIPPWLAKSLLVRPSQYNSAGTDSSWLLKKCLIHAAAASTNLRPRSHTFLSLHTILPLLPFASCSILQDCMPPVLDMIVRPADVSLWWDIVNATGWLIIAVCMICRVSWRAGYM